MRFPVARDATEGNDGRFRRPSLTYTESKMKTIVLAILLAAAAQAQKIEIESDAAADFTHYHTFAIRDDASTAKIPR